MGVLSPVLRGALRREVSLERYLAQREAGFWLRFPRPDTSFRETVGPTPADEAGEAIGLTLDQRMWLGQTRDQYLAGQAENRQNGAPVLAGSATAATYNTSTGAGTVTRVDFSNQSGVAISGLIGGRVYAIDIEAFVIGMAIRDNAVTGTGLAFFSGRSTIYVSPGPASSALVIAASTAGGTQGFTLHSIKEVSQVSATQASAGSQPTWQPGGAEFDGTADNLLTNYTAGSGSNTLIARVTVPASLAAFQSVIGASVAGSQRIQLGVANTGVLQVGVGSSASFFASSDLRGTTRVIGLSFDGVRVSGFVDAAQEIAAAQPSAPTTSTPLRIGATNAGGSAINSFAGSISDAIAWRAGPILDESTFRRIAEQLNRLNAA